MWVGRQLCTARKGGDQDAKQVPFFVLFLSFSHYSHPFPFFSFLYLSPQPPPPLAQAPELGPHFGPPCLEINNVRLNIIYGTGRPVLQTELQLPNFLVQVP